MIIKVLGPGCSKCVEAYEIVSKAVAASGSDATVEKITDLREIMALGVLATPAVVIDGGIMCTAMSGLRDPWYRRAKIRGRVADALPAFCLIP